MGNAASTSTPGTDPLAPIHRSGAVARMLRMPVATLRVWERRYALTNTSLSPGGQRLYSPDDVRRLMLVKRLTELGHAIGSLASLDMAQLKGIASTHGSPLSSPQHASQVVARAEAFPLRTWRLVLVGRALGRRIARPAFLRRLHRPLELLGPFDDLVQAAAALAVEDRRLPVDAWLLHEPQLHAGWLDDVETSVPGLLRSGPGAEPQGAVAVLYGFAADPVCEALAESGVTLLREPQSDVVLAQWLRHWAEAAAATTSGSVAMSAKTHPAGSAAPRRWDDAALTDFASRAHTVQCECPRHVAELLMQLARFEDYSISCERRSTADAELHAFLGRVAASARIGFEAAMEQVALHQGLLLPEEGRLRGTA
jgi:MerR family transcriptional regulator, light-induced transcriptional regulator